MPTKRIRATYLRKQAITLRSLASVLESAAKLIITTEVSTGVARTDNEDNLTSIAAYYHSVADNLEAQGVDLIGVESYAALSSHRKRDSASPASDNSLGPRKPPKRAIPRKRTH